MSENRSYYIITLSDQFISVSGVGKSDNVRDLRWVASQGAKGILEQVLEMKCGYAPEIGMIRYDDYPNDLYIQISRLDTLHKDGWRFSRGNI